MHSVEKEFQYSEKNFQFIKAKIKQLAGINLADTKNEMVYSRVSRLLRQYHFNSFDDYCELLTQNNPQMLNELINAITTKFTSFVREKHHFEFMRDIIFPEISHAKSSFKKLRIWSAGCSTGEEAYSISFIIDQYFGQHNDWDIKILATDISLEALNQAKSGIYQSEMIEDMPREYQIKADHYFDYDPLQEIYAVKEQFKNAIHFKQFNLMSKDPWPMHGPFDVIFCRNVMIYFDRPSQHHIIDKFTQLLAPNGYLILGHSESAPSSMHHRLKYIENSTYKKIP